MKRLNVKELDCVMDQNVVIYSLNGQLYNGLVYELFKGCVDIDYEVVDGMKHGKETEYYPNGNVKSICHYKCNYLDGIVIYYDEDGEVTEKSLFEEGQFVNSID